MVLGNFKQQHTSTDDAEGFAIQLKLVTTTIAHNASVNGTASNSALG